MKLIVLAATLPDDSKKIVYEPEIINGKCDYLTIFAYFCELDVVRKIFPNTPDTLLLNDIRDAWSGKKPNPKLGPDSGLWTKTHE